MTIHCIHRLNWQEFVIEIRHTPNWLNLALEHDHLEIIAVSPAQAKLPITETGYRSHFLHRSYLDAAGGAAAYVTAWLDAESQSSQWQEAQQAARQGSLF